MRVLVAVCGGIAAYKAIEVVRGLQGHGVEVEVAMTAGAEEFVRPLTFASLTGRPVLRSLWEPVAEPTEEEPIEHIAVAQRVDAVVVCPATASTLAKMAWGLADDFVGTVLLATKAPVVVCPAMNVNMWEHAAVRANVAMLRGRGVVFVEPGSGELACGMVGAGRLAAVEGIVAAVMGVLSQDGDGVPTHREGREEWGTELVLEAKQDLAGERVLVTAGGTRERIDPVRFLGNRSSGKMGHALAEAAAARGAEVVVVTASALAANGCEVVRVESAGEMRAAAMARVAWATVVIGAAAVSDFRVKTVATHKLRRSAGMTLELEPTEDILAEVARRRAAGTLVVGFAAETERVLDSAREKLARKGVDAVVANDVSRAGCGFEGDRNAGWFVTAGGEVELEEGTKVEMAGKILDEVVGLRAAGDAGGEARI